MPIYTAILVEGIEHGAERNASRQLAEDRGRPSSPYGLRRDKEGRGRRSEVGGQRSEGQKSEISRLRLMASARQGGQKAAGSIVIRY